MASPAANITQKFRQSFKIVNKDVLRWFPGHMGKGLRKMQQLLKTVDCVIEVHDARFYDHLIAMFYSEESLPMTWRKCYDKGGDLNRVDHSIADGRNPDFQHKICGVRPHILVLNKKDLIERKDQATIRDKLKKLGVSSVFFSNCKDQQCPELKKVIPEATDLISSSNRYNRSEEREYNVLVIGVPNVGKSSLINWLRNRHLKKASAARVGGVAGVTRSVQNRIKVSEEPKVYLLDTPGVLQPTIKNVEAGLKLALCACLQDHLVGEEVIADYLLYTLNNQQNFRYVDLMGLDGPCDDISMVLVKGAIKMNKFQTVKQFDGSLVKKPNVTSAAVFLIREFREGRLGKIILDPIHSDAIEL